MLFLFRVFLTSLFAWRVSIMWTEARAALDADINNAWNFALVVISGIAASVTWAPLLGEVVATPLTSTLNDGSHIDETNPVMRAIRWCDRRGLRRLTLFLCFVEGIRHPRLPAQFTIGMRNARPGGRLERIFATQVFRFDNVANAVAARDILRLRHDMDPGAHQHLEVNLFLLSADRTGHPPLEPMVVPPAAPPPPLARNSRIKLFAGATDFLPPPIASSDSGTADAANPEHSSNEGTQSFPV